MITSDTCLNCNSRLEGRFCSKCGQSASTGRFSLRHIVSKDFFWNVFHVNKGLLFTLKELSTRPGHSVREYINGKRVDYLSYLLMLILAIGFFSLAESVSGYSMAKLQPGNVHPFLEKLDMMVKDHPKLFFISLIPMNGLVSYLFFKRAGQNYAEHLVLNSFKTAATLFINVIFMLSTSMVNDIHLLRILEAVLGWIIVLYSTWFYYQFFSVFYRSKIMLLLRSFICTFLPSLLISTIVAIWLVG